MSTRNTIELDGIEKRYGRATVLHGLSLQLEGGRVNCLLGPNGAGKTTTLQLIAGLRRADAGDIRINGVDTRSPGFRSLRRLIGYMPEQPVLYDHLTGREFLYMLGQLYGVARERVAAVEKLLVPLGLAADADRLTRGYSLGMRKKVAFLGAILHDPAIIVLDEPTSGMDAASARVVKDFMQEAASDGKLVLFTTHVMELAEHFAERVSILNAGRIVFDGDLAGLRDQHGNAPDESLETIFLRLTTNGTQVAGAIT